MIEWKVKQTCSFTTERSRNMALNSYFGQIDWPEIFYALSPYRGYITPLSAFQATSIPPSYSTPMPTPYTQSKIPEKGTHSEIEDLGHLHPNTTPRARGSCLYVEHHLIHTISWDVISVDEKTEAQGLGWYLSYSSDFITPLLGSGENEMSKSKEILYPKSHLTFQSILHTLLLLLLFSL